MLELCLTPIDFYYRYQTLCKGKTVSTSRILCIVAVVYTLTFIHAVPIYGSFAHFGPSNATSEDVAIVAELQMLPRYKQHMPSFTYSSSGEFIFYFNLVGLMSMFLIVYTTILWAYGQIRQTVAQHAKNNKFSKIGQLELQINKVILLQFLIPLLGNGIPVFLTSGSSMMHVDFVILGTINRVCCTWIAALKPIMTVILVPAYRRQVLGLAKVSWNSSSASFDHSHGQVRRNTQVTVRSLNGNQAQSHNVV
ncbi:unnamed protein product [Bursaphelenchus okinawaensis]|uniref:G_PROTEIN_RECEP_F1_2 domain-containing protein n=1 Tax=Bursaphelenchus okinawaensis TaxID=465554 RepID=A0A811KXY9_9BILA|nr:unnamed protein product [Bursaphelenchus okinawaensis]CAG9114326.1 unnamed protein product [Bursaphelenchus okinawaensis]